MGIDEAITATRSPWQNACAERLIESIRRECLDHVIVWNERGLRRVLHACVAYYHNAVSMRLTMTATDARRSVSVRNVLLRAAALMPTRPIDLSGQGI